MARRSIRRVAEPVIDLGTELPSTRGPLAFGVGWDHSIWVAIGQTVEPLRVEDRGGSFAKTVLDAPSRYDVLVVRDGTVERVDMGEERIVVSHVQPYPEGVLLVGGRCAWRPDGAEQNAVVRRWDGSVLRRLTLGDGIAHVRTTEDGTIWCGYFDEGVLGNLGWGGPHGPVPIGAPGLVAFGPDGRVMRGYDCEQAGGHAIDDVYAMNVAAADDVWLSFYMDFPLVHLGRERARAWRPRVEGARALAVRGDRVLFAGGYDGGDALTTVALEGSRARIVERSSLAGPDGASLARTHLVGVGDTLYAFDGRRVLALREW